MKETRKCSLRALTFSPSEKSIQSRTFSGRVRKLRKMTARRRHTEVKYFEILVKEIEEIHAFEEHTQTVIKSIEKHLVAIQLRLDGPDIGEPTDSSGSQK